VLVAGIGVDDYAQASGEALGVPPTEQGNSPASEVPGCPAAAGKGDIHGRIRNHGALGEASGS